MANYMKPSVIAAPVVMLALLAYAAMQAVSLAVPASAANVMPPAWFSTELTMGMPKADVDAMMGRIPDSFDMNTCGLGVPPGPWTCLIEQYGGYDADVGENQMLTIYYRQDSRRRWIVSSWTMNGP